MIHLEFCPLDSLDWVTSLPLAGCQMATDSFDSSSEALATAFCLHDMWPDLQIRAVRLFDDGERHVIQTITA